MLTTTREQIGQRIRKRRLELGLSQTQLAKRVGKSSPAYIAFIEAGERNISTMDLLLIAKELGTTVADLLNESEEKSPSFQDALRAVNGISPEDRKVIEDFYLFLQNKKNK